MLKLVRGLALVAAMTTVSVVALSVADAQEKGKKAAGKTTGIVEVKEGKDGKFRFTIRDNSKKFLAQGGGPSGYATKDDAMKALEKLKEALENPKISYTKSANGKGKGKE
ncbi:MAG TPA: hypothetical protein VFG68_23110 [Fimbriiglobus sp.]|nr:hypothetical protein [Fimbriiglobus sp.]